MYRYLRTSKSNLKYCYLTTKYVKQDACPCIHSCRMAVHCDLTKKPRKFNDCNCNHDCSATKNDLQQYFDYLKRK